MILTQIELDHPEVDQILGKLLQESAPVKKGEVPMSNHDRSDK